MKELNNFKDVVLSRLFSCHRSPGSHQSRRDQTSSAPRKLLTQDAAMAALLVSTLWSEPVRAGNVPCSLRSAFIPPCLLVDADELSVPHISDHRPCWWGQLLPAWPVALLTPGRTVEQERLHSGWTHVRRAQSGIIRPYVWLKLFYGALIPTYGTFRKCKMTLKQLVTIILFYLHLSASDGEAYWLSWEVSVFSVSEKTTDNMDIFCVLVCVM